jgi:hypothetical protein
MVVPDEALAGHAPELPTRLTASTSRARCAEVTLKGSCARTLGPYWAPRVVVLTESCPPSADEHLRAAARSSSDSEDPSTDYRRA